jgi:hypothetical protein
MKYLCHAVVHLVWLINNDECVIGDEPCCCCCHCHVSRWFVRISIDIELGDDV